MNLHKSYPKLLQARVESPAHLKGKWMSRERKFYRAGILPEIYDCSFLLSVRLTLDYRYLDQKMNLFLEST